MKIIIDARALRMYPVGQPGFTGGTEQYVREIAHGLTAHENHSVHVVTPDLREEERRGEYEWWWPADFHPKTADVVVMVHSLEFIGDYSADKLVFATNGVDPDLGPDHAFADGIDAFPVFSLKHAELLRQFRPTVREEQCFVTGLGVDLDAYNEDEWHTLKPGDEHYEQQGAYTWLTKVPSKAPKVPGRMLYANDPARGLWHVLDIFGQLKKAVPHATLHVAYDFDRQFEHHRWAANSLGQAMWECKERIEHTDGVVSLGAIDRLQLVREQLECQVHVMPSDPPNVGSQIHGITQMECAAAGSALVLSNTEAFPEVFGGGAVLLPLPGTFMPEHGRAFDAQDWADNVAELMADESAWAAASRRSRILAEQHTWDRVVGRWEEMLTKLCG